MTDHNRILVTTILDISLYTARQSEAYDTVLDCKRRYLALRAAQLTMGTMAAASDPLIVNQDCRDG